MALLPQQFRENRPWGWFEQFTLNEPTSVKFLHVEAGEMFSLQRHAHRSEYWRVIEGNGVAHSDGTDHTVSVGDEIVIPLGANHRLTGGETGITVLEIAFGTFDESDIERLEDKYGRT